MRRGEAQARAAEVAGVHRERAGGDEAGARHRARQSPRPPGPPRRARGGGIDERAQLGGGPGHARDGDGHRDDRLRDAKTRGARGLARGGAEVRMEELRTPLYVLEYGLEVEWSGVIRLINPVLYTFFGYLIISQMTYTVDSYCMGHDPSFGVLV